MAEQDTATLTCNLFCPQKLPSKAEILGIYNAFQRFPKNPITPSFCFLAINNPTLFFQCHTGGHSAPKSLYTLGHGQQGQLFCPSPKNRHYRHFLIFRLFAKVQFSLILKAFQIIYIFL